MKRRVAVFAIAALLAPLGRITAAPPDTIPVVGWLGVGPGGATSAESQLIQGVGFEIGRWGLRYSSGYGEGDPWHEFQEAAATIGITRRSGRRSTSLRSGISMVRWERFTYSILEDPVLQAKEDALGLPLEAKVTWRVARSGSVGVIAVGNINRLHSAVGLLVAGAFHIP